MVGEFDKQGSRTLNCGMKWSCPAKPPASAFSLDIAGNKFCPLAATGFSRACPQAGGQADCALPLAVFGDKSRLYMRSGISMPSRPMPKRTTLATFCERTKRNACFLASVSRKMLKSW